ncbi:lytic transglycosylase domain-containing protein [Selenomonas ruminantium]|uniref:Lytic transglycosylase domain-containing protein n=1 Tax=Selenomonas ruminantium TaxID=971 RepID=A0A927WSQ0_SELRU|nr:lytic transglycosylase domain-containing protein [Selenomonas ruminantium]MBE6092058.1 lytic transglycosylase domain-containing protein [Selenomonas ruminantium]
MQGFRDRVQQNRRIQRRMATCFCVALFILLVSLSAFFVLQFEPVQRKYFYVYPYHDTVMKYAEIYHVDSNLTAAVIKSESKFKHTALSHRGAVGLMQLMPDTAEWIAGQIGDKSYSLENLHEPDRNIRYGTWYLAELQREFKGNDVLALAAYNAGRGNVKNWMKEKDWSYSFHDIDAIPFKETREYVRQVIGDRKKYRELYPE